MLAFLFGLCVAFFLSLCILASLGSGVKDTKTIEEAGTILAVLFMLSIGTTIGALVIEVIRYTWF